MSYSICLSIKLAVRIATAALKASNLTVFLGHKGYAWTAMKLPSITRSNTHGHAAFLYNTSEERLEVIARYFKEGLAKHELCVYVTADDPDIIIDKFQELGLDVGKHIRSGALRIFGADETYLPDGHFAANFMLANVANYIKEAKSLGYRGLRTAGEMSWIYDHPEFAAEAKNYEAAVNQLGDQHPEFIGLCLYPVQKHFAKVLHDISDTHPSFIYENRPSLNPHYLQA